MTKPLDQKVGTPYGSRIFRHVIPMVYQEALDYYVEHRSIMTPAISSNMPQRQFLNACIRGMLRRVISLADAEMIDILPALIRYMELVLPEQSWGTQAKHERWTTCGVCDICADPEDLDAILTYDKDAQLLLCPACLKEGDGETRGTSPSTGMSPPVVEGTGRCPSTGQYY